jgi:hypothetical protein
VPLEYRVMKLEIEVLDGPQKGKRIGLKNGLQIGQNQPIGFNFNDKQMAQLHAVLSFDGKSTWFIECVAPLKLRLGTAEVPRAALLPSLIFHIGQTGFKVVEKAKLAYDSWDEGLKDWLSHYPGKEIKTDFFFFETLVRLTFIQGTQFEEHYTLSYGPRVLGYNHLDLNIKDPSAPSYIARFFQEGNRSYIENLCGERLRLNGEPFEQHALKDGDRLTVASNVIEVNLLK